MPGGLAARAKMLSGKRDKRGAVAAGTTPAGHAGHAPHGVPGQQPSAVEEMFSLIDKDGSGTLERPEARSHAPSCQRQPAAFARRVARASEGHRVGGDRSRANGFL